MSTSLRRSALPIGVALLATRCPPPQSRAPSRPRPAPDPAPADLIVNELQALGYTVSINWTNGDSLPPLSGCRVISFHNP